MRGPEVVQWLEADLGCRAMQISILQRRWSWKRRSIPTFLALMAMVVVSVDHWTWIGNYNVVHVLDAALKPTMSCMTLRLSTACRPSRAVDVLVAHRFRSQTKLPSW